MATGPDEPDPSPGEPRAPALAWAWRCGPQDAETDQLEARLVRLAACGWEALLLENPPAGADTSRRLRRAAATTSLRVIDVPAARLLRLESPLADHPIEPLAQAWAGRAGLDAIVGCGPEQDAAALLAAARQLRRRLDRLAWQRFQ